MGGALLYVSGKCLIDRVAEALGEGFAVLHAGDDDDSLSRLMGWSFRLPRIIFPCECQCLAVHAG